MALNEVFRDADHLSLPVPADTPSGAPVFIGTFNATDGHNLMGVTETAEGEGGNEDGYATVWLKGAHKLTVSTATAMAVGDTVHITSAGVLTPVATGNALYGHALTAKGTAAGVVTVRIKN